MPQGKSGKYYSNPTVMRQHSDEPSPTEGKINPTIASPDTDADAKEAEQKLQICKYQDGTYSVSLLGSDGTAGDDEPATTEEITEKVNAFISSPDAADQETDPDQQ